MTITPLQTASNTLKILSKKDFSSAVAKWAVQLSPYSCRIDLPRVIIKADEPGPFLLDRYLNISSMNGPMTILKNLCINLFATHQKSYLGAQ